VVQLKSTVGYTAYNKLVIVQFLFYQTDDNLKVITCYMFCYRAAFFLIDIRSKVRQYNKNRDTVVTLFEQTVRRYPDKVALVMTEGNSWTFRDLDLYSNTVANCFREQVIVSC